MHTIFREMPFFILTFFNNFLNTYLSMKCDSKVISVSFNSHFTEWVNYYSLFHRQGFVLISWRCLYMYIYIFIVLLCVTMHYTLIYVCGVRHRRLQRTRACRHLNSASTATCCFAKLFHRAAHHMASESSAWYTISSVVACAVATLHAAI